MLIRMQHCVVLDSENGCRCNGLEKGCELFHVCMKNEVQSHVKPGVTTSRDHNCSSKAVPCCRQRFLTHELPLLRLYLVVGVTYRDKLGSCCLRLPNSMRVNKSGKFRSSGGTKVEAIKRRCPALTVRSIQRGGKREREPATQPVTRGEFGLCRRETVCQPHKLPTLAFSSYFTS